MISTHSDEYDSIENILMDDLGKKTYRVQQHRLEEKTNHVSLSVEENLNEELNETPEETLARWEEEGNPAAGELRRALGKMELGEDEASDDVSGETPEETLVRWVKEGNPAADELRKCLEEGREAARMVAGRRKRRGDGTSGSDRRAKEARRDPLLRYCRSCGGCFGGTAVCEAPHCWIKGGTLKDTSVGRGED